ncbi:MAG: 50S ribosomal protein L10 [Candidatus Woesearchaeota archaeon]
MTEKSKNRVAKEKEVQEFAALVKQYPVVGIVNMQNLPTPQLQIMRESLRGTVLLKMTKTRILRLALKESGKENAQELEKHLKGMPALLLTKESPFKLYKTLKKKQSAAPIRGGQVAPNDIIIPAGPTPFAPGPVIGELGRYKVKTGVENGKIAIKEDAVVAKEGAVVNAELAGLLTRLSIKPMKIGLDLKAVLENGEILTKEVLDVDEDAYIADLTRMASEAFNLAMFAGITNDETIKPLLQKVFLESKTLALEANIMTDLTAGMVMEKAEREMLALKGQLNLPEVTKESKPESPKTKPPKKEEAKPEEKKEEKVVKQEEKAEPEKEQAVKKEEPKQEEPVEKKEQPEEKPTPKEIKQEPKEPEAKAEGETELEKSIKEQGTQTQQFSEEDKKKAEEFVKNLTEGKLNK